jgi:hypothetical protein
VIDGKPPTALSFHKQFNTPNQVADWTSIVTARSEPYPARCSTGDNPSTLETDLNGGDFTVNAMAIGLPGKAMASYTTPVTGKETIDKKIRIKHDASFIDYSTRLRGCAMSSALGFMFERIHWSFYSGHPDVEPSAARASATNRIVIFKGEKPEKVYKRATGGVLQSIPPRSKIRYIQDKVFAARENTYPNRPPLVVLLLLTYGLDLKPRKLIFRLRLPKQLAQPLRDCSAIKDRLTLLAAPEIKPSEVYHLLFGYSLQAMLANIIAAEIEESHAALYLYMEKLHGVKSIITGSDLLKMGITQGPLW